MGARFTVSAIFFALLLSGGYSSAVASQPLVDLVMQGQVNAALEALEQGADPNMPTGDNTSALMYAAYLGEPALVQALLEAGADPTARNDYGATAIGEAAFRGHTDIIRYLLEAGTDPDQANDEGETPLMVVARAGNTEAARLLLDQGAEVDAREQWGGQTALMWAAAQQQGEIMRLLIARGADVDLHGFARIWDRRITSETRPKDMNKGGFSALLYAARQGYIEGIEILAEAGADLNATDPDRVSALNLALINFHFEAAATLIRAGADINQWDLFGRTPLYIAIDMNSIPGSLRQDIPSRDTLSGRDIAAMLLERGANPNAQLKLRPPFRNVPYDRGVDKMLSTGATPLMMAASIGDVESVRLLLNHGALPDLGNMYATTPFMLSAGVNFSFIPTRGHLRTEEETLAIMEMLVEAGVDINRLTGDPTLPAELEFDRPHRRKQMSPADEGPDIIKGKNALHGAARHGWLKVASYLIDLGVKQEVMDASGRTPLDYARGAYPPAFNDSQAEPNEAMIALLTEACNSNDACRLSDRQIVEQ